MEEFLNEEKMELEIALESIDKTIKLLQTSIDTLTETVCGIKTKYDELEGKYKKLEKNN